MSDRDEKRLERQFARWETRLPPPAGRSFRGLRDPSRRWLRVPIAILLMVGGLFSFLPILGVWMIPLGLLLLAQDLPLLRRPMGRALVRLERVWSGWKRRGRRGPS